MRREKRAFFNWRFVRQERRRSNYRALGLLLALVLLYLFLHRFVVGTGIVTDRSMLPTLPEGSYYLIHKYRYRLAAPQRGDVVVFRGPDEPKELYVKRVIALPGDTLTIAQGQVFVNGQPLAEPYSKGRTYPPMGPLQIQEGTYFVMGDNRQESYDSRIFGPIPLNRLEGKI